MLPRLLLLPPPPRLPHPQMRVRGKRRSLVAFLDGSVVFSDLRHPQRPRQPRLRVDVAVVALGAAGAQAGARAAEDAAFNSIQKL